MDFFEILGLMVRDGPLRPVTRIRCRPGMYRKRGYGVSVKSLPGPILRFGHTNSKLRFPLAPAPRTVARWEWEQPGAPRQAGLAPKDPAGGG